MEYRPDTEDELFHPGDPLTGVKGTRVPVAFFNELLAAVPRLPIYVDASEGPVTVDLSTYSGEVVIVKTDDSGIAATIVAAEGHTVLRGASIDLTVQDDFVRLRLNGTNWGRV